MLLVCKPGCTTCRQVEKMLKEKNVQYEYRDMITEKPSPEELKKWHEMSGLDISRLYNAAGKDFKADGCKSALSGLNEENQYAFLSKKGIYVKRPILITEEKAYIGTDVKKFVEGL